MRDNKGRFIKGGTSLFKGKTHSVSARGKMSKSRKGKILTEAHKANIRKGCIGINTKQPIKKVCKCGKVFFVRPSWDRVKHCSYKCGRLGRIPWNKGLGLPKKIKSHERRIKKTLQELLMRKRFRNQRYKAVKRNAFGSHTFEEWELLKIYYKFMCLCCKQQEPQIKLTEDHIMPLSMGGTDNIDNIQPLCQSCNTRKHAKYISYLPSNHNDLIYTEKGLVN